ncbi:hypothetical protein SAMN05216548_104259 [Faunimonas pinastri]|uniref:Neutral zinc metallopeptidase n=1 Tax=Faunimonas pinastri TaxID=1855383 RepID=A0A1H9FZD8_9HYPH|nr:neutral zinc metallopeptidase [Faunimonas pinastri]SEQ43282.1 hypothetical protein SAMN05216548_104259 [Faunimonas pinastri]
MRLDGQRESDNIEDRRGSGGGLGGGLGGGGGPMLIRGGGGIGGLIIIVILALVFHVNPLSLLSMMNGDGGSSQTQTQGQSQQAGSNAAGGQNDQMRHFVGKVLGSTEDVWTQTFQQMNMQYQAPTLVLFSGATRSGCGNATEASGPFYCPNDRKVYIDLGFYDELRQRFHAPGDFAEAYVLAHEVGHHVQNLIGILPRVDRERANSSQAQNNALSVRLELQADCFAGVWAAKTNQQGLLEAGDIDEALNAASQIGDDTLQKQTQGYAVPDSFTHGTSAQRKSWFTRGFQGGNIDACDTFGARTL